MDALRKAIDELHTAASNAVDVVRRMKGATAAERAIMDRAHDIFDAAALALAEAERVRVERAERAEAASRETNLTNVRGVLSQLDGARS